MTINLLIVMVHTYYSGFCMLFNGVLVNYTFFSNPPMQSNYHLRSYVFPISVGLEGALSIVNMRSSIVSFNHIYVKGSDFVGS